MARHNKIYAGPFTEPTPQAIEALASVALIPGIFASLSPTGQFVTGDPAGNAALFVVQDNYLLMKGVDAPWAVGETAVALRALDEQFFNVRVATGNDVKRGAALELLAGGKVALASGAGRVVAYAEETYNNNTGVDQLIRVRAVTGFTAAA